MPLVHIPMQIVYVQQYAESLGLENRVSSGGSTNTNWHIDVHYVKNFFTHTYFAIFVLHSFCQPMHAVQSKICLNQIQHFQLV